MTSRVAPSPPRPPAAAGGDLPGQDGAGAAAACAAWSRHAADLAAGVAGQIQPWPESPATRSMVLRGELLRLRAGMYVPPGACASAVDRAVAVGCAVGPALRSHQVIAGTSAAWVLLGGIPPDPMELISPSHRTVIAGVVVRQSVLAPQDVEMIGGAPITVPARTAVDLLRLHARHVAVTAVEDLVASGHLDLREVRRRLDRLHGAPFARRAQELLDRLDRPASDRTVQRPAGPGPCDPGQAWAVREARASTCLPSAVTR